MHFLAHLMTDGTPDDLRALDGIAGIPEFREVLNHAPPGIFDPRSWAYWHLRCGTSQTPPLPIQRGLIPRERSET